MRIFPAFLGTVALAVAPAGAQAPAVVQPPAVAPTPATQGQPIVAPVPDWVEAIPLPAANPALRDRPLQTLLSSSQSLYGPDRQDNYTELTFLIQNAQGLQGLGNITLPWQPDQSELIIHKVQIIRNGQVIDQLAGGHPFTVLRRENNLEMATLDGVLTAVMQPEGLAVGDILTVAFTMRRHGGALPLRGENFFFLNYGAPVRHYYVRQIWPSGSPIRWRGSGIMQQARTRTTRRGTELLLDLMDAEGTQPPTMAPARMSVPTSLQISEYRDWPEVSAMLAPHFQQAETLAPASPLRAEVDRIAASTTDKRQRAMAALRLVQDQIRYFALVMGDGNYLPATADQSWARRFADCKGKTVTLLALLHGLGDRRRAGAGQCDDRRRDQRPAAGAQPVQSRHRARPHRRPLLLAGRHPHRRPQSRRSCFLDLRLGPAAADGGGAAGGHALRAAGFAAGRDQHDL